MTWVNISHTWGWPAIRVVIARAYLQLPPLNEILEDFVGSADQLTQLETLLARDLGEEYPGIQLIAVDYDLEQDALTLLVTQRDFPRVPPYAQVPEWYLWQAPGERSARFVLRREGEMR